MTELTFAIYGNEAEIVSTLPGNTELLLRFSEPINGFLNILDRSYAVSGGKCLIKINALREGEITPKLITTNRIITLPRLIKDGNTVFPADCDDSFIRKISKRERDLEKRISELEKCVEILSKSVYGTSIFN